MYRLTITLCLSLLCIYSSSAQSWELIYEAPFGVGTNIKDEILDLCRVGDSTIWVCGGNGSVPHIAVSYNDGESWTDMTEHTPEQVVSRIRAIYFISENFGLIYPDTGIPEFIFYTENGGQSWQTANVNLQNSGPIPSFAINEVVFKDEHEGWALREFEPVTLLNTTDGGLNWDIQLQVSNEGKYRNIAYHNEDTLIITTNEHLVYSYDGGER